MKKIIIIFIALIFTGSVYCQKTGDTVIANNNANLKVKVLYFHITNRCNTCYSIENNVRKTLFENFQTQLDSGFIDLYILNCELPENQELVKKYEAYGATLAVTNYANGKEIKSEDISNWAFQKASKPEIFVNELEEKITKLLK